MTKIIKAYREKPLSARQDKRVDELLQRYHLEPPSYLADENYGKIRITMSRTRRMRCRGDTQGAAGP
jgi:hypothetical protein